MTQVQPRISELHSALELLRIVCPLLAAANTASIHQCRCTACSVASAPLVGTAQGNPFFCGQIGQGAMDV